MTEVELLIDFLNSRDDAPDAFATPETFHAWLAERGLLGAEAHPTEDQARNARRLRAALLSFLVQRAAGLDERTRVALNRVTEAVPLRVELNADGGAKLVPSAGGVDGLLTRLVGIVYEMSADGTLERLKVCASEDCGWTYLDNSKNHSRVWCDMGTCGARHKVRAYRARKREAAV